MNPTALVLMISALALGLGYFMQPKQTPKPTPQPQTSLVKPPLAGVLTFEVRDGRLIAYHDLRGRHFLVRDPLIATDLNKIAANGCARRQVCEDTYVSETSAVAESHRKLFEILTRRKLTGL